MRKLLIFNLVTMDGFFEGPNREIGWHNVDAEFNEFAIKQLDELGGLLFGRVTYQLMAGYWPTPTAIQNDPIIAGKMNSLPKFAFSRTLEKADWNNTRRITENAAEETAKLKQQPGKDLALFGSSDLAVSLIPHNLIDEFRIIVNPVVLGRGKPLFQGIKDRLKLELTDSRIFRSGNVLLYYQPAK